MEFADSPLFPVDTCLFVFFSHCTRCASAYTIKTRAHSQQLRVFTSFTELTRRTAYSTNFSGERASWTGLGFDGSTRYSNTERISRKATNKGLITSPRVVGSDSRGVSPSRTVPARRRGIRRQHSRVLAGWTRCTHLSGIGPDCRGIRASCAAQTST